MNLPELYLWAAIGEVSLALLLVVRLALGPSVSDRIVALNTIATQAALGVLFFAAYAARAVDIDVAIWLASFSYLGTVVWARYLERGLL